MGGSLASFLKAFAVRFVIEGRYAACFIPRTIFHAMRYGTMPFKERHVYTRAGRLRLRYIALMVAAFLGLATTNISVSPNAGIDLQIASAQAGIADVSVANALPAIIVPAPPKPGTPVAADYTRKVTVRAGDTLSDLMQHAAISNQTSAIEALKGHINPRELKAGQDVTMHYRWSTGQGEHWTAMEFAPDALTRVVLRPAANGFKVEKMQKPLTAETRAARAQITTSLYADLQRAGVPDSIIADFIKVYSYSVDFQRDIWAGDSVELLYKVNRTDDGEFVRGETLEYATLVLRGKRHVIFRFDHNGQAEYFDEKGNPVKKALMRTPIDGARVTSGFGMRRHPIQGYTKMHKGTDFGAPTGTPIFAAGDGVVGRAGWFSGYGKYVSIKHNGTYSTAYGHMSSIAVKPGQRVKQGQVIGRVGMTGMATGPHLHFEVMQNGAQINPVKLANLSIGNKLGGKQWARFQAVSASAKQSFQSLISGAARPQLASIGAQ